MWENGNISKKYVFKNGNLLKKKLWRYTSTHCRLYKNKRRLTIMYSVYC